jgi:hypothetical protein
LQNDDLSRLPTYHERFCAFVDILGFSGLIDKLAMGATEFEEVRGLLRTVHTRSGMRHDGFRDSDFRAQSISDAVCISAKCNNDGLAHIFWVLTSLTHEMLLRGFFIRGAIVKDFLYHDEQMVFGKAQVRAFLLEREVVLYPRIMITGDVVNDAQTQAMKFLGTLNLADFIALADDGPRYLDTLALIPITLKDSPDGQARVENLNRFNSMARQIQRRYDESRDNPRHFQKVQWFGRYWNSRAMAYGVQLILRQAEDGVGRVTV